MSEPAFVAAGDDETLAECVAVIRAAFQAVLDELGLTRAEVPSNAAFLTLDQLRVSRARGDEVFALRVDGRSVGSASLRQGSGPDVIYLKRLAVAPAFQRRGYGAMLLDRLCAEAAARGAVAVSAAIIDENFRLKRWYQRHGFVVTGTRVFDHLPFTVCYLRRPVSGTSGR